MRLGRWGYLVGVILRDANSRKVPRTAGRRNTKEELPISFSGAMVRLILDGKKTQTRRIVKPGRRVLGGGETKAVAPFRAEDGSWWFDPAWGKIKPRYGEEGQKLWVRETWAESGAEGDGESPKILFLADFRPVGELPGPVPSKWKPSTRLKREHSRLTLEVTGVRVERLLDISDEDARDEGFWPDVGGGVSWAGKQHLGPREAFFACWDSLCGRDEQNPNPWVWVYSFRKLAG